MQIRLRRRASAVFLAASCTAAGLAVAATDAPPGDDLFMANGTVRVEQPIQGDLIVMGGNVDVTAPVSGDVVVAGGNVGIPLALVCLALYLALLPVTVALASIGAGDALLARWFPARAGLLWPRCMGAAACLAALAALQAVPPLGAAMAVLASLVGAGSLLGLRTKGRGGLAAKPPVAVAAA